MDRIILQATYITEAAFTVGQKKMCVVKYSET